MTELVTRWRVATPPLDPTSDGKPATAHEHAGAR